MRHVPNATELIWILEIPNNAPHTLENYEKWFSKYDWNELTDILFCGSVDEPTINPELTDLVLWAHRLSKKIKTYPLVPNGGTRDVAFWHKLGLLVENTVSYL